jgi:hypothetical protein
MPTNKAVLDVVEQWSASRPDKMSQSIELWWNQTAPGSSHSALLFDPDGIADLVTRLSKAFPASPALEASDFRSAGAVKTVQDLVDALQPPIEGAAVSGSALEGVGTPSPKPATLSGPSNSEPGASRRTRKGHNRR